MTSFETLILWVAQEKADICELEAKRSKCQLEMVKLEVKNLDFNSRNALDKQKMSLMQTNAEYNKNSNEYTQIYDEVARRASFSSYIERVLSYKNSVDETLYDVLLDIIKDMEKEEK